MVRANGALHAAGVVALAALVVLAGCGGSPGGTPESPGAGPGQGESIPDVSNTTLPPGVNASGLTDVAALLSAHRQAMASSGFAYRFDNRLVETLPNNTTLTPVDVSGGVRATANLTSLRRTVERDQPDDETVDRWSNGTAGYRRVVSDETVYETASTEPSRIDTTHYMLRGLLRRDDWNLSAVSENGSRIVLVSDDQNHVVGGREVSDTVSGRLVLDGQGRILLLNMTVEDREYVEDWGGTVFSNRTFVYEVTQVGDVSVSRPDWVEAARNATSG